MYSQMNRPQGVPDKRALLRERGFSGRSLPLDAAKPAGVALTSNAARVAGLGRILFLDVLATDFLRSTRIEKDRWQVSLKLSP
jgi:hypothetical protein